MAGARVASPMLSTRVLPSLRARISRPVLSSGRSVPARCRWTEPEGRRGRSDGGAHRAGGVALRVLAEPAAQVASGCPD